jgi:hypothetical protein
MICCRFVGSGASHSWLDRQMIEKGRRCMLRLKRFSALPRTVPSGEARHDKRTAFRILNPGTL